MLEGKAMVEDTDMTLKMQAQAMAAASRALDRFDVSDCRNIAAHIKKVIKPSIHLLSELKLELNLRFVAHPNNGKQKIDWIGCRSLT
jgi:hypothetical protein